LSAGCVEVFRDPEYLISELIGSALAGEHGTLLSLHVYLLTPSIEVKGKFRMAKRGSPDRSPMVLLLIDVINHFEFPDGKEMLAQALPIAPRLARLKTRARAAGTPVIYVNDNFGQWRSDQSKLLDYCLRPTAVGRRFVEQLRPDKEDYFVLKPRHSAFYQTPLEVLLTYLGASSLVLCGLATNSCIVCTAHDAKMRNFELFVPSDCSASLTAREHKQAIEHIKTMTDATTASSASLRLAALSRGRVNASRKISGKR
jgi:nicotinamidase-related amidase